MQRSLPYCFRCGEINPHFKNYYLDHLSKRFCTMRCRLACKADLEDWKEAHELQA